MIRNFRHRGLARLFEKGETKGVQQAHVKRLLSQLNLLDTANHVSDMDLPGYHLHPLKGEWSGFWSVRVSGNWRVIFRFEAGDAYDVDYLDYH
jgi:proteic killer suppression protein